MSAVDTAHNWKFLFENIDSVVSELRKVNAATDSSPRATLRPIRQKVDAIMKRVRNGNLSKLGKIHVARDVAFVYNSLNSTDQAIETGAMTRKRINEVVSVAAEKMDVLRAEIRVHLEHKSSMRAGAAVLAERPSRKTLENSVAQSQSFDSFKSAMSNLLSHVESEEAAATRQENVDPTLVQASEMSVVRERHLFDAIRGDYDDELRNVLAKLGQFRPSEQAQFAFVKMPIVVISNRQIPTRNLDNARMKYRVVPFPGIQHGASPGGRHEQTDTYGVILEDQLVAAIPTKSVSSPSPSTSKTAPTPVAPMGATQTRALPGGARKVQSNQALASMDMELTREQIPAILKMRVGHQFVDVLGTSGTRTKLLTSRRIPGFKFIWFLRADQYGKMGALNMREVGLPFRET